VSIFTACGNRAKCSAPPVRARLRIALAFLFLPSGWLNQGLKAQSAPEESEQFEAASIRPTKATPGPPSLDVTPTGIRVSNVTLKLLIQFAYDITPEQLSGGDGWTESETFAVIANGSEGGASLSPAEQNALTRKRLQTLLRDRFHLSLKREVTAAAGYALTVDGSRHKMTPADDSKPPLLRQRGRWLLHGEGVEMSSLARFLSVHLMATVVDRTGLDGRYNFDLNWTPETIPADVASLNGLPEDTLIPAVRDQLGLKLERQKVQRERYRIEHAEKPTVN
jgi:uncharacterized protein (TIGR03435 family)